METSKYRTATVQEELRRMITSPKQDISPRWQHISPSGTKRYQKRASKISHSQWRATIGQISPRKDTFYWNAGRNSPKLLKVTGSVGSWPITKEYFQEATRPMIDEEFGTDYPTNAIVNMEDMPSSNNDGKVDLPFRRKARLWHRDNLNTNSRRGIYIRLNE